MLPEQKERTEKRENAVGLPEQSPTNLVRAKAEFHGDDGGAQVLD